MATQEESLSDPIQLPSSERDASTFEFVVKAVNAYDKMQRMGETCSEDLHLSDVPINPLGVDDLFINVQRIQSFFVEKSEELEAARNALAT